MERLRSERAFHDRQAEQRARDLSRRPGAYCFSDEAYLDHESWIAAGLASLGPVQGRDVLDLGCGHGMAAVVLARRGARVRALDLSSGYLREASARAAANGVALDLVCGDGHNLPFADASFDLVWGNAVLHHLEVVTAARELFRVLRPGGRAVLCEPWGENAVLAWARQSWSYPGKARTADERALRLAHVRLLRSIFPRVDVHGFQLLGMLGRVVGSGRVRASLERLDRILLNRMPRLQRWCRYVTLVLHKDPGHAVS